MANVPGAKFAGITPGRGHGKISASATTAHLGRNARFRSMLRWSTGTSVVQPRVILDGHYKIDAKATFGLLLGASQDSKIA